MRNALQKLLKTLWFRLNEHYCMCEAYHAQGRRDIVLQTHWENLADEWRLQQWRLERGL